MPYARRNLEGTLISLHRQAESGAEEFLPDDDAQVRAFVGLNPAAEFERLDADFIRVLEDLIDVLIRAKVINLTDLPGDAQKKLLARRGQRKPTALGELNLLGERSDFDSTGLTDFGSFG